MCGVSFIDEREADHDRVEEEVREKAMRRETKKGVKNPIDKEKVIIALCGVLLGVIITFSFGEYIDKRLPPGIEIEKSGKVVGYADTNPETSEFIYVKNAKSPGIFLAYPIFGDKEMNFNRAQLEKDL